MIFFILKKLIFIGMSITKFNSKKWTVSITANNKRAWMINFKRKENSYSKWNAYTLIAPKYHHSPFQLILYYQKLNWTDQYDLETKKTVIERDKYWHRLLINFNNYNISLKDIIRTNKVYKYLCGEITKRKWQSE